MRGFSYEGFMFIATVWKFQLVFTGTFFDKFTILLDSKASMNAVSLISFLFIQKCSQSEVQMAQITKNFAFHTHGNGQRN